MMIYLGNCGTSKYFKDGYGRVISPELVRSPNGIHYVLDNGAWSCYVNNKPFDGDKFDEALTKIQKFSLGPDFVVCPDIVAGGMRSLYFSLGWIHKIPAGIPAFLAVQDGMTLRDVLEYIEFFDGLFVGGTLEWKLKTGNAWVDLAHSQNMKCHIGRVGTFKRLLWARWIGADSVDSSTFIRVPEKLSRIKAMRSQTHL